jgi:FkbM family methyltransferase
VSDVTYTEGILGCFLEMRLAGFNPRRILDIGANVGQFCLKCHDVWPEAHVTSIEANENCIPQLRYFADEHHHAALSDCEKDVVFWSHELNPVTQGNSYYRETLDIFPHNVQVPARTTTLSALLAGKEPYDLVKLDTQGSELDIIRGGRNIVRQAQYVLCEMSCGVPSNAGAPSRSEVEAELLSLGFGDGLLLEWWTEAATMRRINEDWIYRMTD